MICPLGWKLGLEDLVYVRRDAALGAALAVLRASLAGRAAALLAALPACGPSPRAALAATPQALVFRPAGLPFAVRAVYAVREADGPAEPSLQPARAA